MTGSGQVAHVGTAAGIEQEFRRLAVRYSEIAATEGIRVVPFHGPDLPLFHAAPVGQRAQAIEFLRTLVEVHEEVLAEGARALDSRKLLWRALSRLSLVPRPDIFEKIEENDIVLLFSEQQSALFWTLRFFEYASFNLEQIVFQSWYAVTRREPAVMQVLYELAISIISGKVTGTFKPAVPGHVVEELDTPERLRTWMELPWGSTLTRDGQFGGILMIQRMRIVAKAGEEGGE